MNTSKNLPFLETSTLTILLIVFAVFSFLSKETPTPPTLSEAPNQDAIVDRVVVVIIDSLREKNIREDMPELRAFASQTQNFGLTTCLANFTLPCIETIFSGSEAAPTTALHNFTGTASSSNSIVSDLKKRGWGVYLYSDHTLGSLYGRHANQSINIDDQPGSILTHDLELISMAKDRLDRKQNKDFVILHIPGTDKKAHFSKVGGKDYRDHFAAVDNALISLLKTLRSEKDLLLVTGDHGHDDKGTHTSPSIALLQGPIPKLTKLPIAAKDLRYILSFATSQNLPALYDGRTTELWDPSIQKSNYQKRFETLEKESLITHGYKGEELDALRRSKREKVKLIRALPFFNYFSVFLFFCVFVIRSIEAQWINPLPKKETKEDWRSAGVLSLFSIFVFVFLIKSDFEWLTIIGRLAFTIGVLGSLFWKRKKFASFILFLALSTSLLSFYGPEIQLLSGDPGDLILILYGPIVAASLLFSLLFFPSVLKEDSDNREVDLRRFKIFVPRIAFLIATISLPSGVYFPNSSVNFFDAFIVLLVLVTFASWVIQSFESRALGFPFEKEKTLHFIIILAIGFVFQFTESLTWKWTFPLSSFLTEHYFIAGIFLVFLLLYVYFNAEWKKSFFVILLPHLIAIFAYSIVFAHLSFSVFSASLVASLFLTAVLKLQPLEEGELGNVQDGIVLYAAIIVTAWICLGGFDIANVDFAYFDQVFPNLIESFSNDRNRFVFYGCLTFPKYILPFLLPLSVYFTLRGFRIRALLYAFALLLLQVAFLSMDIISALASGSQLYSFALNDLVFIWVCGLGLSLYLFGALVVAFTKAKSISVDVDIDEKR